MAIRYGAHVDRESLRPRLGHSPGRFDLSAGSGKPADKGYKMCSDKMAGLVSPADRGCRLVLAASREAMEKGTGGIWILAWWHWLVVGLGLGLLELARSASFFIIWFGLGALLVGIVMMALPDLWSSAAQVASVDGGLGGNDSGLVSRYLRKRWGTGRARGGPTKRLGEIGILVQRRGTAGRRIPARGEVRFQKPVMGSDVWPCLADEAIAAGERVQSAGS
jgi:membrane protein implicated in regulation of membrane protease activity